MTFLLASCQVFFSRLFIEGKCREHHLFSKCCIPYLGLHPSGMEFISHPETPPLQKTQQETVTNERHLEFLATLKPKCDILNRTVCTLLSIHAQDT